jgi:hypothetical protein
MLSRVKSCLLLTYLSMVYAAALVLLCGVISWGAWYSPSSYHRDQSNALLHGDFALSHNPADLDMDLCWSEGGVHQVWGLGISFWRLPFDFLAHVFGYSDFPDRIALGCFMALAAYTVGRTWFGNLSGRSGNSRLPKLATSGAVALFLFFAPLVNLLRGPLDHYGEPLVFVYYFGVLLACGVFTLTKEPTWRRFWLLSALAGIGGFIRPTLVLYGFATIAIAGLIMLQSEQSPSSRPDSKTFSPLKFAGNPRFLLGLFLFACGGGLLFITNYLRFGNGWEFGHRLNVSPALTSVYTTRFDYPYKHIPLTEAARELFGAMFRVNRFNDVAWYDQEIFTGQSPTIRWRGFNMRTYDLSYAVLLIAAWVMAFCLFGKWLHASIKNQRASQKGGNAQFSGYLWLSLWSMVATSLLTAFYLRVPAIADRYMLDFAPAFAASLAGFWLQSAEEITKRANHSKPIIVLLLIALVGWQSLEIGPGKNEWGPLPSITEEMKSSRQLEPRPMPPPLPKEYKIGDSMISWGIPYNGEGWDSANGQVWSCAIFLVENPEFLELELEAAPKSQVTEASLTTIQAKVGLEFLERRSIIATNGSWVLRFAGPRQPRYQKGLQPVFLAMVPREEVAQYVIPPTPWLLKHLSWRKE